MMHRLPSYLKSVLTVMVAFVVAILLPATVQAAPLRTIEKGGIDATGAPVVDGFVVVFDEPVDVGTIIRMFGPRYKASTGEELTIGQIQARNPANTFPRCNTPEGNARPVRIGDIGAWTDAPVCAEKDRMLGLGLGYAARLVIPLQHVETYEEKMARLEAYERCDTNAACLQGKLTVLGVTSQQTPPSGNQDLAKRVADQQTLIAALTSTNDSLTERATSLMLMNAALTKTQASTLGKSEPSRSPWEPAFALAIGLGLVVSTSSYAYRRGKKNGQKTAENAAALVTVPSESIKVVTAPDKAYADLYDSHASLTNQYNLIVRKNEELAAENERLRSQPVQQFNISGGTVQINTASDARERETKPEIRMPATEDASDRPSQPLLPAVALPVVKLVLDCIDIVSKTRRKIARRAQELFEKGEMGESMKVRQFVGKFDRALEALESNALAQVPALSPPSATPPIVSNISHNEMELMAQIERDVDEFVKIGGCADQLAPGAYHSPRHLVLDQQIQENRKKLEALRAPLPAPPGDRDSISDRVTLPEAPLPPSAPNKEQEAEIAALKARLAHEEGLRAHIVRRLRERVIDPLKQRVATQQARADDAQQRLASAVSQEEYDSAMRRNQELEDEGFELKCQLSDSHRRRARLARHARAIIQPLERKLAASEFLFQASVRELANAVLEKHHEAALANENWNAHYRKVWCKDYTTTEVALGLSMEQDRANNAEDRLHVLHTWQRRLKTRVIPRLIRLRDTMWTKRVQGLERSINDKQRRTEVVQEGLNQALEQALSVREDYITAQAAGRDTTVLMQLLKSEVAQAAPLFKELVGFELPSGLLDPPPSATYVFTPEAMRPSKAPFDPETTVVASGDYPASATKNGNGHAPTNGPDHDLPTPEEIVADLDRAKQRALLSALSPDNLPEQIQMDRYTFDRMRRLYMTRTVWTQDFLMRVPPHVMEKLLKDNKPQPLINAINCLAREGVFIPDTLYPVSEHKGLPPIGTPGATNGA